MADNLFFTEAKEAVLRFIAKEYPTMQENLISVLINNFYKIKGVPWNFDIIFYRINDVPIKNESISYRINNVPLRIFLIFIESMTCLEILHSFFIELKTWV